ncbi:MAG: hypothetical protein ABI183_05960 [Polyangiaceae bacterium]
MKLRLVSTVLFVGLALIACSSSSSTSSPAGTGPGQTAPATQTIGSAGGTVTASGVTLTIPAGALSSDTAISITPNAAAIPNGYAGLSSLFEFQPTGTKFATPATIAFTLASAGTNPTVYWSNDTGTYDALDTSVTGTSASASIQHFSTGFAASRTTIDKLDAGKITDDGGTTTTDAGAAVGSFNVTVDGVATSFANNAKVTLGVSTTTIQGDDDPSATHWTIQIILTNTPQQSCVLNGVPMVNYTHYTSGTIDKVYGSKFTGGSCTLMVSSYPANPGDLVTGTILTGALGKGNAPVSDPATHALSSGSFNLTL